ncbi:ABC transporter permease [Phaeovulum sp.]|uniref:ABC transporter permease n=1 Tax=Phaeovulum sp. TaxID=2934796 RepID=UPI0039E465AF
MIIGGIDVVILLATLMAASVPVLLAATGELIAEKSGVLNLGVEGMMIIGAIAGFAGAVYSHSPVIGFLCGALAGATMALLFAVLTLGLLANQVATGLALTLFGMGLSALVGKGFEGVRPPPTPKLNFGALSDLPVLGKVVFSHDWMVYGSLLMVVLVALFLSKTRAGLILRAVGENHDAAHALGYRVVAVRMAALAFGGAMAGLGGAYLSLVRVPQWTEGMTANAGWIALAIVVFASWKPERVLLGAYLFGGITALQLQMQVAEYAIPVHLLSMAPYLVTIIVLVIISARHRRGTQAAPAALGRPFHASR